MKKQIFLVIIFYFIPALGFAQFIDDMPYSNPDRWTYFQQEMSSLMHFQIENNPDLLLFINTSVRFSTLKYTDQYLNSIYRRPVNENRLKGSEDLNLLLGVQGKISSSLYLSSIVHIGLASTYTLLEDYEYPKTERPLYFIAETETRGPTYFTGTRGGAFLGLGLFTNTNIIKGGIYLGLSPLDNNSNSFTMDNRLIDRHVTNHVESPGLLRIAFVPQVNTVGIAYIGKVLNNIFGYFGLGDNIITSSQADDNLIRRVFANTLNLALNLTFNRIDLEPLSLHSQIRYSRGNFDAAAKNDIFGLKIQGDFSRLPFGFVLDGGYKHFFSVSEYFLSDYTNTGYFNGTIIYRTDNLDFGIIYYYDNIYKTKITLAASIYVPVSDTAFKLSVLDMSGFWGINPAQQYMDKNKQERYLSFDLGLRSRFGWKFNK